MKFVMLTEPVLYSSVHWKKNTLDEPLKKKNFAAACGKKRDFSSLFCANDKNS
jgi:hypothetical protein